MILCDMRESLLLRAMLAASDNEGATDDEVVAMIERITKRPFMFGGVAGLAVLS